MRPRVPRRPSRDASRHDVRVSERSGGWTTTTHDWAGTVPPLPDSHPRRGMSTVAALSTWLVHTNRRRNGAWTQRYEQGIPVTGLLPIPDQDTTGTTVHFMPVDSVHSAPRVSLPAVRQAGIVWPHLHIEVIDERTR